MAPTRRPCAYPSPPTQSADPRSTARVLQPIPTDADSPRELPHATTDLSDARAVALADSVAGHAADGPPPGALSLYHQEELQHT